MYRYDYYYGMPETSTVSYRLTYTTQDGRAQEVTGASQLTLENFPDNGDRPGDSHTPSPCQAGGGKDTGGDSFHSVSGGGEGLYGDLVCGRCAGCCSAGFAGYGYPEAVSQIQIY